MSDTVLYVKYFYNCHYNILSKLLLLFSLYRWKNCSIKYITYPHFRSEPAFKLRLCESRVQVLNSVLYSLFSKQHCQWFPSLLCCKPWSTSQTLNPSNWADGAGVALYSIWPPLSNHFLKNLVVCRDEFYTRFILYLYNWHSLGSLIWWTQIMLCVCLVGTLNPGEFYFFFESCPVNVYFFNLWSNNLVV